MSGFAALAAATREARRRGATALLGRVTSPSARALSCSGAARDASDASSFVDVEKAQERARLKAAALAAQSAAESGAMHVFDRAVKAAHRDRAAYLRRHDPSGDRTDPFLEEITKRTLDRLNDVKRAFENVLVLGAPRTRFCEGCSKTGRTCASSSSSTRRATCSRLSAKTPNATSAPIDSRRANRKRERRRRRRPSTSSKTPTSRRTR